MLIIGEMLSGGERQVLCGVGASSQAFHDVAAEAAGGDADKLDVSGAAEGSSTANT